MLNYPLLQRSFLYCQKKKKRKKKRKASCRSNDLTRNAFLFHCMLTVFPLLATIAKTTHMLNKIAVTTMEGIKVDTGVVIREAMAVVMAVVTGDTMIVLLRVSVWIFLAFHFLPELDIDFIAGGYEMNNMTTGDAGDFFTEVNEIDSDIEVMKRKTQNIRSVHQRSLQDIDAQAIEGTQEELRKLTEDASISNRALSTKIRILKGKVRGDPGKQAQADRVEKNYKAALIEYQKVIVEFQERVRNQIKRQVKIVKPDATEEELEAAVQDGQGQIFSQAVSISLGSF